MLQNTTHTTQFMKIIDAFLILHIFIKDVNNSAIAFKMIVTQNTLWVWKKHIFMVYT